jgi:hypothetical protein
MRVKELTLSAVISTSQYNNISPSITIEVGDDVEGAKALGMSHIESLASKYGERPLQAKTSENRKLLNAFVGGSVFYDEVAHVYTNEAGEQYLSGSAYAETFRKPFDKVKISDLMAKKAGVSAEDIIAMWELKGKASRDFGNSIHSALQLFEQYGELAKKLEKTTHLHDNLILGASVTPFFEAHKGEKAMSEVLVVDHTTKRAGQIDRLLITGDKKCIVCDFKTNANIDKDLPIYQQQLSFYASIMSAGGWTVESLRIHHYNGDWKDYDLPVLEVK